MQLASRLQARGFDIRGIRPPTVPAGTARLRIALTLNVDEDDVRALLDALVEETKGWSR
jgi:8-amino-7-oxononanoate synthase